MKHLYELTAVELRKLLAAGEITAEGLTAPESERGSLFRSHCAGAGQKAG